MRVMGVDPGLTRCGLSMIEGGTGRKVTALDVDVVRTPSDVELHRRLLTISDTVEHWMDTHRPDVIAIERVFANQNANTAMGTAQAGGVIALAAARRGIDLDVMRAKTQPDTVIRGETVESPPPPAPPDPDVIRGEVEP